MSRPTGRPVAVSLRLYRALASAFPYEFKNAYGDELMQVTEDSIEPIWRRHGVLGLVRLLADVAIRVPMEHLAELRQDVRHGLRVLAGSPGTTAVALISLSLGIGVATSAFSDLNGTILRNVPGVGDPDELVALEAPSSYQTYTTYSGRSDLFSSTFAYLAPVPFGVSSGGRSERAWGHLVTPSYFATLGVRPSLGRLFGEESKRYGHAPAVVVSHRFWENRLGSDPLVVGKTLRINGYPATIIGVGPKDFLGASPMLFVADLWMPIRVDPRVAPELADGALERRDRKMLQVVGRLKPGVTAARAEAELDTVARQLEQSDGEEDKTVKGRRVRLLPGGRLIPLPKQSLPLMATFFAVLGGMILLIACSNVVNILLARAADRRKEIAVRLALGAGRARLIRQLLTESMLLAAGAGGLGLLLTVWLMRLAARIKIPYPMPVRFEVEPDGRVLLFTLALTTFTGLVFGLVPALRATRTDLTPALKEGGDVRVRGYRRLSLRNLLVLSQVAGSLTLLVLTAFLVLGYRQTIEIQVRFNARGLGLVSLDPIRDGYSGAQTAAFFEQLLNRVKSLPSITAASLTKTVPMALSGGGSVTFSTSDDGGSRIVRSAHRSVLGRDYFETLGLPILLGRGFLKEDEASEANAVVVSEEMGRSLWPGGDPVGRRLEIGDGETAPFKLGSGFDDPSGRLDKGLRVFEVVGVARNEKENLVKSKGERRPVIYFPLRPADLARPSIEGVTLMVRAAPGADAIGAVRREVSAMDDRLTPFNARSMTEQIDETAFPFRVAMWTYLIIGVFGLILASVGLAGVTAYSVTQRRREIGIRIALGANRGDILGLVMKEGMALVTVGAIIGLAGAWAGMRLLGGMLSGVAKTTVASARDPFLLGGASLVVILLTLAACYVPARRSLRIDPVVALRQE